MIRSRRFIASGLHALASLGVATLAGLVVFLLWYPPPYDSIAGGVSLFLLIVSVDVVLGPSLTAVIANPNKPVIEFRRDLVVIVLVQIAALTYGLYTIALARPVHLVFEVDRMRVVTAADIEPNALADAPASLQRLPWFGPTLIAAVKPDTADAQMRSTELGLAGIDLSMDPRNWRDYSSQSEEAWKRARPLRVLLAKYPSSAAAVNDLVAHSGKAPDALRFLPLQSRQASWVTVIAAPQATIVGHLPLEGFF